MARRRKHKANAKVRVDITLPESWEKLSQEQLRFLLTAISEVNAKNNDRPFDSQEDFADVTAGQIMARCFLNWSGLSVVSPYADGWLVKKDDIEFFVSARTMEWCVSRLDWCRIPPESPVRLDTVDGASAVPADISSGFSFDAWLACETSYQCYQSQPDDSFLRQMASILYAKEDINPTAPELLGVFYWWAGLKNMLSQMFPNLFNTLGPGETPAAPSYDEMRRSVDTQIRALTKGDVTKEKDILAIEAMRALTELDALAREYDELNSKFPT